MIFKKKEEKPKPKHIYLQIRLKEDEKEALRELAEKHNMNLTDFVKNACNDYAEKLEGNSEK